ncbi:MAG: hypothetical protein ABEK17_04375 [Candidatus Aenigmatarchaeota archaeon]
MVAENDKKETFLSDIPFLSKLDSYIRKKHMVKKKTSKNKKKKKFRLSKSKHNPIITPDPDNEWEAWQTFNPAAVEINNRVHFLYRAVGDGGGSRFGYANSKDGFKLDKRFPDPVYEHESIGGPYKYYYSASGGSFEGCEDPRMVKFENEGKIYVTYTACDGGLRVGLTSIEIDDFVNGKWNWSRSQIISPPGEVHKNWVIFPEKINGKYAILHSISPEISIKYVDSLDFDRDQFIHSYYHPGDPCNRWDSYMRGAGPPPIETDDGWLLLYHAMNHDDMGNYKVGAMLLDKEDPTKILHRCDQPLLVPEEYYENEGFKAGVVYASGAVVKDDKLIVYYGGSDSYVCAAYANFDRFMERLKSEKKKPVRSRFLKFFKSLR